MTGHRTGSRRRVGPWPALAVVVVLFGGALAGAVRTSVAPTPGSTRSLDAWGRVLGDPRFHEAAAFTVGVAIASTVLSVALALPLAAVVRDHVRVRTAVTVPVLVPHLVVATVAVLWLGPGGLADRVITGLPVLVRDPWGLGMVLVYLVKEVPFLALLAVAAWDDEVADRVELAATLGLPPAGRLRHVVWPATRAPLLLGGTVVMAFVLGSLQVPLVVGPTTPVTTPVYALQATRIAGGEGRADAAVALLTTGLVAVVAAAVVGLAVRRLDGVRP